MWAGPRAALIRSKLLWCRRGTSDLVQRPSGTSCTRHDVMHAVHHDVSIARLGGKLLSSGMAILSLPTSLLTQQQRRQSSSIFISILCFDGHCRHNTGVPCYDTRKIIVKENGGGEDLCGTAWSRCRQRKRYSEWSSR
jgi:hypothetical protein